MPIRFVACSLATRRRAAAVVAVACAAALAGAVAPTRAATVTAISGDGTLDSRPPAVSLAFPPGIEKFVAAAVETLHWTVTEDGFAAGGRPVRLALWDGAATVWADSVAAAPAGVYTYAWVVPDLRLPAARLIVSAVDAFGLVGADTTAAFAVHNSLTGVAGGAAPARDALAPNRPNPFNPRTTLRFDLAAPASVELAVFDLAGRRVALLATGSRPAGSHAVTWDGRDERGRAAPSGAYFARLRLAERGRDCPVVRMTLIR